MRWFCTPFLLLFLLVTSPAFAMRMNSTNFEITSSVILAGGGSISSTNFILTSTQGQASSLGVTSSTSFKLGSGFCYTLFHTMIGDVDGNGRIGVVEELALLK